jgi:hypothetical protein
MAKLSKAAKDAADAVAGKLANKGGSNKPANNTPTSTTPTAVSNNAIIVPGLTSITPDVIQGMLPKFDSDAYYISDPLNPPETLPQVTESAFNKGISIYEGAQRALKLTGAAFDTTALRFNVLGKQARSFGAGVKAAKEFEVVKGDYLDWKNQLQITEQKSTALSVSEHKTTTDSSKAVHTKAEADQKLKQAEIGADLAREVTRQKQSQLDEFKKQLGDLVGAKAS